DGEAGDDERRRVDEGARDVVEAEKRAAEQPRVDLEREQRIEALRREDARHESDEPGNDQAQDHGSERHGGDRSSAVPQATDGAHAFYGAARPPVAISRPASSRFAVRPSRNATISPRYITPIRSETSRTSS